MPMPTLHVLLHLSKPPLFISTPAQKLSSISSTFQCKSSKWAERLLTDFTTTTTTSPTSPPTSSFLPMFPDTTTTGRFVSLQINFYKVLGAEPHFLGEGIKRAFEALLTKPPQYGFSAEALVGRRQILQAAYDTLANQSSRAEYDRALVDDRDNTITIDVDWDKVPGALCALQEAGEAEMVIGVGDKLLRERPTKQFKQDVVLVMALAYVDLSRDAMAVSPPDVVKCCEVLEQALKLLQVEQRFDILS